MDNRLGNFGFSVNHSTNAFKSLSNFVQVGQNGGDCCMDTTLRLHSPVYSIPSSVAFKGIKQKSSSIDESMGLQAGLSLSLGAGHSSSSSDSKGNSATTCSMTSDARESDEESKIVLDMDFALHLGNEKILSLKNSACSNVRTSETRSQVDLELSLSIEAAKSDLSTYLHLTSFRHDLEGTSSSHQKMGNPLCPLHASLSMDASLLSNQVPRIIDPVSIVPGFSPSRITMAKSSVACTSRVTLPQRQRSSSSKTCQFKGCGKGARGASGLCITHGGGQRCQRTGCHIGAEGRTVYCKAHGGGQQCDFLGCTKSAEGRMDYCIVHGAGHRCSYEGCSRAARGKSGLCIRHGGGKRCLHESCTKSAEGLSGLCISHGGGRRCEFTMCNKGAQGSTVFCKAHGGGKRCTFDGCTSKGAHVFASGMVVGKGVHSKVGCARRLCMEGPYSV